MKRRKRKSLLNTSLAVYLSLNIQIQQDNGEDHLLTLPLVQLSAWLMAALQLQTALHQLAGQIEQAQMALCDWLNISLSEFKPFATLLGIGVRSLLYGFGVTG